ncbi:MarR family winged helix-turn-helix transcriptional regulator [Texcoconibacillus texcoconensis]|uniref:MarR family 2-MHQ and catechol resistance regulon transcriptional repressor n=1 Tax=Texcoconibacillus texcoconensis TaxID=1095777 RepID=A0A840QRA5_9BACI|nr:MarR family transcriptional regulator [Texcoconibacillus texcoconensis]MBB5173996.1 MarR family 2-MHQ and catechol resistance regulon transcriptional repressor [Texcoconibacillus texcoconensis]
MKNQYVDQDLSLKLFVVLSRATRAITDQVEEDIKSHGLNPTEFAVLELLYHKGEQPIQQIGKKVLLASGSITYVVDKLEKKGYLHRKACPKDRRVTYAMITEEGSHLMAHIFPKHSEGIQQIFGGLGPEEKEVMIEKLKKLGFHAKQL